MRQWVRAWQNVARSRYGMAWIIYSALDKFIKSRNDNVITKNIFISFCIFCNFRRLFVVLCVDFLHHILNCVNVYSFNFVDKKKGRNILYMECMLLTPEYMHWKCVCVHWANHFSFGKSAICTKMSCWLHILFTYKKIVIPKLR